MTMDLVITLHSTKHAHNSSMFAKEQNEKHANLVEENISFNATPCECVCRMMMMMILRAPHSACVMIFAFRCCVHSTN